jgi:hypothetical protein
MRWENVKNSLHIVEHETHSSYERRIQLNFRRISRSPPTVPSLMLEAIFILLAFIVSFSFFVSLPIFVDEKDTEASPFQSVSMDCERVNECASVHMGEILKLDLKTT